MLGWFKRHRIVLALLAVSVIIGAACAKQNVSGNLTVAAATARVAVDFPDASIVARNADPQDRAAHCQKHAVLYGRLMTTPPVLAAIARAGRRAGRAAFGHRSISPATSRMSFTQAGTEQHASRSCATRTPRIGSSSRRRRSSRCSTIYAEAPSYDEAMRLANAAVPGLRDYLTRMAAGSTATGE